MVDSIESDDEERFEKILDLDKIVSKEDLDKAIKGKFGVVGLQKFLWDKYNKRFKTEKRLEKEKKPKEIIYLRAGRIVRRRLVSRISFTAKQNDFLLRNRSKKLSVLHVEFNKEFGMVKSKEAIRDRKARLEGRKK